MTDEHPVRVLRKGLGLSQEAFAHSIEISGPFQCQVEGGRDHYGRETVLRIRDRYGLEMDRVGITVEHLLRGSMSAKAAGLDESVSSADQGGGSAA